MPTHLQPIAKHQSTLEEMPFVYTTTSTTNVEILQVLHQKPVILGKNSGERHAQKLIIGDSNLDVGKAMKSPLL